MQTFVLRIDRQALADTLLERAFILGYNQNRDYRVIISSKPDRPVSDGSDERFTPEEQTWKLNDLAMELRSAARLGDCSGWTEPALSPFEEAIGPYVEFEREFEKGVCVRRSDGCYLKSWSRLPIYHNGNFEAFAHGVEQLLGFDNAVNGRRVAGGLR